MKQLILCMAAFILFGVVATPTGSRAVPAGDGTRERSSTRVKPVGRPPDGKPVMILPARAAAAVQNSGCQVIGDFINVFSGANRFRGDVFSIDRNVELMEVQMELDFVGTVELFFSVFERIPGGMDPDSFDSIFEAAVSAVGTGTPTFYSSGPIVPPLPLVAGKQYVIGVAWTSTDGIPSIVRYADDGRTYPRPFLFGQVEGLVAVNNVLPPLTSLGLPTIFTTGAYSLQLCFETVEGACCVPPDPPMTPEGSCAARLPANCTAAAGFFFGQTTTCAEFGGNCVFGACCGPCGGIDCSDRFTPEACAASGGSWAGDGIVCGAGLCTPITGACCSGTTCSEKCEADCLENINNEYLGDGTTCQPNMCAGACCIPNVGCVDLTQEVCGFNQGSVFKGDGTTCDSLPPSLECGGACCVEFDGTDACLSVSKRSQCTEAQNLTNPTYMGDFLTCSPNVCPPTERGACCFPNGSCFITNADACDTVSFSLNATCSEVTCTTACCVPNQGCSVTSGDMACTSVGGSVLPARNSCVPDLCDVVTGACCFSGSTTCQDGVTLDECRTAGGRFEEGPADCSISCPVLGACCRPNGTCSDRVTMVECIVLGGDVDDYFEGVDCASANVNCPPIGACCSPEGNCSFILQDDCLAVGGSFVGAGIACGAETCPTGACCLPDDTCTELTGAGCVADGGNYRGDGTACDESVACGNVPGACCMTDGTCSGLVPQACLDAGGVFLGELVLCVGGLCPSGACCLPDDTCFVDLPSACAAVGGEFGGAGTACLPNLCTPGACCLPGGSSCSEVIDSQCTVDGGEFQGAGTDCLPNPCISIVSSDPPNCAIDARQPSEPDGSNPAGWDFVKITFSGNASGLTATDFTVEISPGPGAPPGITGVSTNTDGNPNKITLQLDGFIPTQQWTCFVHNASGTRTCLGSLPADVNADGISNSADILRAIECLNGVASCELWQCDVDRSGACGPSDILRLIDLLNGAGIFESYIGLSLPACPSGP